VGAYWTFKDYVSASGRNEILDWLDRLPPASKATLTVLIQNLEASPTLGEPHMKKMRERADLYELRSKADNIQYRPLCCYGPGRREVTILIGAAKKGRVWDPSAALKTAETRMKDFREEGRTCDHDFS
jgi:hypothetical protein